MTLFLGQSQTLKAEPAPAGALTWHSSAEQIVTVTGQGVVKGIGVGTATVTVAAENGSQDGIVITVPEGPNKVCLNRTKGTVVVGTQMQLLAKSYPTQTGTAYTWSSSKKKVATVSKTGLVTALSGGTTVITVKTSNGKKTSIKVTVPAAPRKVRFGKKSYAVKKGKKIALIPILTPVAARTRFIWSSSNLKIATVTTRGVVKGLKKGTVTITVKTVNGKSAKAKVTVK